MSARRTLLPGLMVVVGIAIVVRTLTLGGGPAALGIVLGVLFCAAGALRLWAERRERP
ncbi:MAG: hypothetical protein ACR2NB_12790 [Solirubrobacteraceae bacterium]